MQQNIYKANIKTTADRALFFSVVLVGIAGAILLKTFSTSPTIQVWAPLAFDLIVLTAYALAVINLPLFQLRDDRAGDSFYYVGLLLTLGSLAHTLWQFGISKSDDATQVISGFGIALASTILGLALRVFVQHFRFDPIEVEKHVRDSLVDASRAMTGELYSVVAELATFRQSMKQVIEESTKEAAAAATTAMTDSAAKFSTEVETLVNALDGVFDKLKDSATSFTDVSKVTVSALSKLSTRIEKIEPPSNVVEFVFGPARDHMVQMAQTLTDAAAGQKEQIQRLGTLVATAAQALSVLDATISSINTGAQKSLETINFVQTLHTKHEEIANALASLSDKLAVSSTQQQQAIRKMEENLGAATRTLSETTDELSVGQREALAAVSDAIALFSKESAKHAKEIENQMSSARSASGRLVNEIVSLADAVAEKLA